MAILCDLAVTAAEFHGKASTISHPAWMACHFSPYSVGLSNLPEDFPRNAMVILNDRTPAQGHDPHLIARQLRDLSERLKCSAVLLDFQRPDSAENAAIAQAVLDAAPCPVGISELYASGLPCPVFLSPVPPHIPLQEHIAPWNGREIWLEAALGGEIITITEDGAAFLPFSPGVVTRKEFVDETLFCHYEIEMLDQEIRFSLYRTGKDLTNLLANAEKLGITRAVGLYQELGYTLSETT